MKRVIFLSLFLLFITLGCSFVERLAAGQKGTQVPGNTVVPSPTLEPGATRAAPTPITCEDDSCLNSCLERINRELPTQPQEEVGGNYAGMEASFNLVTYTVEGDQILEPDILWVPSEYRAYQEDIPAHQLVWDYFASLIPTEQRKWITRYTVFTDGRSNTLAWVGMLDYDDNSKWELGVDILDSTHPLSLTRTLVHEVAHLLTLNSEQIPQSEDFIYTPLQNSPACPQFMSVEGCSTPESYINKFYQEFWTEIYGDWMETVYNADTGDQDKLYQAVQEFYLRHTKEFSRAYAATNIKEDMAVSFENFILEPEAEGSGVIARKTRFFQDFPELTALRTQMIQSMCSYVQ